MWTHNFINDKDVEIKIIYLVIYSEVVLLFLTYEYFYRGNKPKRKLKLSLCGLSRILYAKFNALRTPNKSPVRRQLSYAAYFYLHGYISQGINGKEGEKKRGKF